MASSDYTVPSVFTKPSPSMTATLASSYVPPFADPGAQTIVDTTQFSKPTSNPYPTTPPFQDDYQWIDAYLTIHKLSVPSYRYTYLLWFVVVLISLLFALFHCMGCRRGAVGGLWNKWSLRRTTWRKQRSLAKPGANHKQPLSLPSNAQLFSLAVLCLVTFILCFVGPDYIAPGTRLFDVMHNVTTRELHRPIVPRAAVPVTSTTSQPGYTILKAWWTAGGRTGIIAFALFPLCVLFALKAPPFAIFANSFLTQLYSDKLAFLHRWSGRLLWLVTALHIALWGVQLGRDKRSKDNLASAWSFAFQYTKFIYGWLGFICLTLLVVLSFRPVRIEFYEPFYLLHIILVPLTLIFSALHFPPISWWCWGTLILWGAERFWRFIKFTRVNGVFGLGGRRNTRYISHTKQRPFTLFGFMSSTPFFQSQSYDHVHHRSPLAQATNDYGDIVTMDVTEDTSHWHEPRQNSHLRPVSVGEESIKSFRTTSSAPLMNNVGYTLTPTPIHAHFPAQSQMAGYSARGTYMAPPGYAHATLLPGRTVRLRFIPPHHFTWAPGQHVLLTVPSISNFNSHPFTIASVCDKEAPSDDSREVVLLIRTRTGFTKRLWKHVDHLEATGNLGDQPSFEFTPPRRGVLLRAYIDGPFGSSVRSRWTSYSTVLIFAGGSGVTFATGVLEYACLCMLGRDGKSLGGSTGLWGSSITQIRRIRFVWFVREFSHIQWAASLIRRCMDAVKSPALQINIFVTNLPDNNVPKAPDNTNYSATELVPPKPSFMPSKSKYANPSQSSLMSDITLSDDPEYQVRDIVDMYGGLGYEEHALDLTNFDYEDDTCMPGETQLSQRLRKEGRLRRAETRKKRTASLSGFNDVEAKVMSPRPISSQGFLSPSYDPLSSISPITPISPASPMDQVVSPSGYPPPPISFPRRQQSSSPMPISPLESKFDLDEVEARDMLTVAERARPGRPRLDAIIAEEARRCQGSMVVACCGPMSLNAVVRKYISQQIDPVGILHDKAPNIDLVSEDFEW